MGHCTCNETVTSSCSIHGNAIPLTCDCCGEVKLNVVQTFAAGCETWACEKCRSAEDDAIAQFKRRVIR